MFDELKRLSQRKLRRIIKGGRSEEADWITDETPLSEIALTVGAMANTSGGIIVAGVDDGAVVGLDEPENTVERIIEAALILSPPLITPLPYIVEIDDEYCVVVHIPEGMPHIYAMDGRYVYREGHINAPLKPLDLRRLFMQRGEIHFESEVVHQATIDDLDTKKIQTYINNLTGSATIDPETVLLRRGCLIQYEGELVPTNAGILLFGNDPQRFVRGAEITAARFAGETMSDTFSRQDISGTLPDQIRRAETFLVDHLRKDVKLQKRMARTEAFEYPMEAARELVVNAVAHRDYSIAGDDIRLFLFQNRMEVCSPGGLAGPVTIDNIKDERFSRNPVIVQVLSDMGFIERLGYGVDRVIELMNTHNLEAPDFKDGDGVFKVVLYNAQKSTRTVSSYEPQVELDDIAINPRQEAAIAYLQQPNHNRITNKELQRIYPDVHAETIRRDLADLVTKNILEKMGQKRGSYYVLKRDTN